MDGKTRNARYPVAMGDRIPARVRCAVVSVEVGLRVAVSADKWLGARLSGAGRVAHDDHHDDDNVDDDVDDNDVDHVHHDDQSRTSMVSTPPPLPSTTSDKHNIMVKKLKPPKQPVHKIPACKDNVP